MGGYYTSSGTLSRGRGEGVLVVIQRDMDILYYYVYQLEDEDNNVWQRSSGNNHSYSLTSFIPHNVLLMQAKNT